MAFIAKSIPNLIDGISEQPASARLRTQADLQENFVSSVVKGLIRRQPTKFVKKLLASDPGDVLVHWINRDATERYVSLFYRSGGNGVVKVFDLTGTEKTVTNNNQAYINTLTASTSLRALTVADYTFVTNFEKTVALDAAVTGGVAATEGYLIFVKQAAYSADYKITLNGKTVAFRHTSSTDSDSRTNKIAQQLAADLTAQLSTAWAASTAYVTEVTSLGGVALTNKVHADVVYANGNYYRCITSGTSAGSGSGPTGTGSSITDGTCVWEYVGPYYASWEITRKDYVIKVHRADNAAFTLGVEDSQTGTLIRFIKGSTQRFSDLPVIAPHGYVVKIQGGDEDTFDDFYVKFTANDGSFSDGYWDECPAPNVQYKFDNTTMPHTLIRNGDGTFTFDKATWGDRVAGDTDTAPAPSFVGQKVRDLFFFEERLGIVADQFVCMSEVGQNFNFWPTTVMTDLDSDPIDVGASDNKVETLQHAVPWNGKLLLMSQFAQFALSSGSSGLSPRTAKIHPVTAYEVNKTAQPVGAGRMVYFAGKKGENTAMREYLVSPDDVDTKEAPDITEHVPTFLPDNPVQLEAAVNSPFILVRSSSDPTRLFVYNYFWRGDQKVQSAWHKWEFPGTILGMKFFDDELYLVVKYSDGVYLEKLSVAPAAVDTGLAYVTHLDRRIDETQLVSATYDAGTDRTTLNLPYDIGAGTGYVVVTRYDAGGRAAGQQLTLVSASGTAIVVSGDKTTWKLYIGKKYTSRYRFSRQYVNDPGQQAQVALTDVALVITLFTLTFEDTGSFIFRVTPDYNDSSDYSFTGRVTGAGANVLGQVALATGSTRFMIGARNDAADVEIIADSFQPTNFQSASWSGRYAQKAQRVGGA